MPGKIKVKILAGRNLPVMDRSGDTTDAYVEIKFGTVTYKTDVCRKSLNPQWNSEWYKFEVDDAELQDEPLQIRLMDHDTYSANDAIGKVYLDLNPLLLPGVPPPVKNIWTLEASMNSSIGSQGGSVMTGWIPVYDTMHGIRGEVNIIVKVELFSDFNKFRQSSCGVQLFYSPNIPYGHQVQVIHGFVEELVVSDDPEYKWIDKIRTPRASNEARQTLFFKLSGEVQRKIGLKALDLGGNAVIGYIQNFDLEGESGIVARGIGTAVTLSKLQDISGLPIDTITAEDLALLPLSYKSSPGSVDSDDGAIFTSHSPNRTISDSTKPHILQVSKRFPGYGKGIPKHSRSVMKVSQYRSVGSNQENVRQLSLQSYSYSSHVWKSGPLNKLQSDDLTDNMSVKSMLALEDMRGEPTGNRFSRGLKNLRNLPQTVLSKKSTQLKFKTSDEESDLDSIYSSAWSIVGSDSTRSSMIDLHQSEKKKKFSHKRSVGEGMAALLIRSVHAGLPLDSVREDHETPTPSPVNFSDESKKSDNLESSEQESRKENDNEQSDDCQGDKNNSHVEIHELTSNLDSIYNDNRSIPMISSSETDTSTSDDDQSESSTNYNILDDSSSLVDQGSPGTENCISRFSDRVIFESPPDMENSQTILQQNLLNISNSSTQQCHCDISPNFESDKQKIEDYTLSSNADILNNQTRFSEETELLLGPDTSATMLYSSEENKADATNNYQILPEEMSLRKDQEISQDFGADLQNNIVILPHAKSPETGWLENQVDLVHTKTTDIPLQNLGEFQVFRNLNDYVPNVDSVKLNSDFLENGQKNEELCECIHARRNCEECKTHKDYVALDIEEVDADIVISSTPNETATTTTENSFFKFETDFKRQISSDTESFIHNTSSSDYDSSDNDQEINSADFTFHDNENATLKPVNLHGQKEKSPRKVERTDTVIYKGFDKDYTKPVVISIKNKDITNNEINPQPLSTPIPKIIEPPKETNNYHLQIPIVVTEDVIAADLGTSEIEVTQFKTQFEKENLTDNSTIDEKAYRKYRQSCMLDLLKIIDTKMMVHPRHGDRKDSTRSRRKRRERFHKNLTPSPDSLHRTKVFERKSKSKSPDKHIFPGKHSTPHNNELPFTMTNPPMQDKHALCTSMTDHPIPDNTPIVEMPKNHVSSDPPSPGNISTNSSLHDKPDLYLKEPMSANLKIHKHHISHKAAAKDLAVDTHTEVSSGNDINIELQNLKPQSIEAMSLLAPSSEPSVLKSHSACNLQDISEQLDLTKITNNANTTDNPCVPCASPFLRQQDDASLSPVCPLPVVPSSMLNKVSHSPATKMNTSIPLHRRSSDSDLSITPKGNSLTGSDRSMGGYGRPSTAIVRTMNQDILEMLEYPFITMQQYPPGFILHLGGLVSARSVKLLERISNLEEPESRDAWWTEIRMEVRSHARALACNVVIGYKEETSICDDVCVLNASGTAAVINLHNISQDQEGILLGRVQQGLMTTSMDSDRDKGPQKLPSIKNEKSEDVSVPSQQSHHLSGKIKRISESNDHEGPYQLAQTACNLCHLPYSEASVPFRVNMSKCAVCRRAKVPDVLFATIELPDNVPITGRGCFIQATVCKCKRDLRGELNAKEISDCLPFLEYELHSLLLNKLKVKGMNAIFGLKVQVSVGERLVVGMAVGTAVFLTALPAPSIPQIASGNSWHNEEQLAEIQKNLVETVRKNKEFYELKTSADIENGRSGTSDTDESDDELPELDLGLGTKDACVLEIDDIEDIDRISLLMDDRPPDDFHIVNTQSIPGLEDLEIVRNLQMFTQVSRAKIPTGQFALMPSKYFARLLQTVYFKLRRMVPCALCDLQFKVALPEQDEIQLSVIGMALGLGEPTKGDKHKRKTVPHSASKDHVKKPDDSDMIFSLDEDHSESVAAQPNVTPSTPNTLNTHSLTTTTASSQKPRPRSPLRIKTHTVHRPKHVPLKERYGIDITPLSYLPGGRIERYLGNLNFFFIRESTSIRENGGLSGFTHSFMTEVLAIARAHIRALGGNAMVAFFMSQCVLLHSPHKNQGQCLINVGGDVVSVSYFGDEKHLQNSNC
ncbi:uncharacterized protein LOC105698056 isoform X2 [Orussus abietinus]|uniref:uncharacterized protein LOC105698056 isoform X2 n=1 Tax=Orussus abietinus TaxID=222816 RepID=UPI0006263700|nr:uncharacterized protein LOC105698056 isoform X2 [Orussus abietinus]